MAKSAARRRRAREQRSSTPIIVVGILAAVVLVGILVFINLNASTAPTAAPQVASGKIWGQANAPVTIDIYSDFQ